MHDSMDPFIKSGTQPSDAAERLRVLVIEAENVVSGAAGMSWPDHQRQYLLWVERSEVELQNLFEESATWQDLYSERHWRLRSITEASPRPFVLLQSEIRDQVARLTRVRERLLRLAALMDATEGVFAVLDTHVLLHYAAPDQVDWPTVIGRSPVRLVVPLRVVEEVDEKKYTARDDRVAARARGVVARLRDLVVGNAGGPVRLRDGVTIEVPMAYERRQRTLDADEEVLGACLLLKAAGGEAMLVSGDAGLAIRATARRVPTAQMPERYARRRLPPEAAEVSAVDQSPGQAMPPTSQRREAR
jgi:hypothetical protein